MKNLIYTKARYALIVSNHNCLIPGLWSYATILEMSEQHEKIIQVDCAVIRFIYF